MVLVPQNPTINNVLYSNTIFAGTLPRFQTYPYYHPTPILLPSLIVTSHSTNGNYPQIYPNYCYCPNLSLLFHHPWLLPLHMYRCPTWIIFVSHCIFIYIYIYLYYTYIHSQSFSVSIAVNPPVLHCPPIMVITHHHPLVLVKSCHLSTNLSSLLCWWLNHVQWLCLMVIFQLVLAKVLFSFLVKSLCLMAKSQ